MEKNIVFRSLISCITIAAVIKYVKCSDDEKKSTSVQKKFQSHGSIRGSQFGEFGSSSTISTLLTSRQASVSAKSIDSLLFFSSFGESSSSDTLIVTADDESLSERVTNDATKYDKRCASDTCEYVFNEETRCVEVIHQRKTIWKYDPNTYGHNFPERVLINYSSKACWVFFEKVFYIFKYRCKWKMIYKDPGKATILDIKSRIHSPAYVSYYDESLQMKTFIANEHVLFRAVTQGNNYVWIADSPFGYADKVIVRGLGSSSKKLIIHVLDGPHKEFKKLGGILSLKNQWTEKVDDVEQKTYEECVSSNLINLDINTKNSTNQFIYTRDNETDSDVYVPIDGYYIQKCFHKPIKYLFWAEKDCNRESSLDILIVTLNDEDDFKFDRNNTSKYTVRRYNHILQYSFTENAKCVEVGSKNSVIWKHDAKKFPDYVKELFNAYHSHYIYQYNYEWLANSSNEKKRLVDSEFSIFSFDIDSVIRENDYSHYIESEVDSMIKLVFKPGVRCVELKYENKSIWQHIDDPDNGYPLSIYIHKVLKVVFLEMSSDITNFYRFSDGEWKLETLVKNENFKKSQIKVITKENDIIKENDITKYEDVSFGLITAFRFKGTIDLIQIKFNNNVIYHSENASSLDYPISIFFLNNSKKRLIWDKEKGYYMFPQKKEPKSHKYSIAPKRIDYRRSYHGESLDKYDFNRGKGKYRGKSPAEGAKDFVLIDIDVSANQGTEEFELEYRFDTKTKIFTPKKGFLFKSFRDEVGLVWLANNTSELSDKIYLFFDDHANKELIYRQVDGCKRHFYKKRKALRWALDETFARTSVVPISEQPEDISVFTIDDVDPSKCNKNDFRKYQLHKYGNLYHYVFNQNSKCVEVKSKRKSLWRCEGNMHPKEMYIDCYSKNMILNDFRSHYIYQYNYEWLANSSNEKKRLVDSEFSIFSFDIDSVIRENDYSHYIESEVDSMIKLVFKPGVRCVELKYENKSIWQHIDDPDNGYPLSIYIHKVLKVVFLEMSSDITNFYRFSDGEWKLETLVKNENFKKSQIKVITKENDIIKENDITKYEDVSFGLITAFRFANTVDYVEIYYRGNLLFKNSNTDFLNIHFLEVYFLSFYGRILVWDHDKSFCIYPDEL
ncbi:uncharacterized protein TOT_020000010 [Theileria orientalis strain Shintoku]|uniref:SfiI-subtelomeric related protein family member n=1 Tax=Theileria orientalis strain Shintoku TaxID=869250 RepID=J4CCP2_THEOR|nr:uncharacterized protein TOT_020000010 [Theileria orientalis strain Shintoku]BAM39737.1 uncharacterized protein TOT_020000010 [Theileria orientalis strain Shintoku]|eukprot:XP_009690038.1 uncharacterized protein TOT_020000010 [Theileria orientalis strain Shintoku]